MSRLTEKEIDYLIINGEYSEDADRLIREVAYELREYRKLEEQGRLIELPCLPNEEVWESHKRFGTHKTMYASREAIVGAIEAGYIIGHTKEEAEAKLAEMEGAE